MQAGRSLAGIEREGQDTPFVTREGELHLSNLEQFDDGVDISVGEWKKVALARAFLSDTQLVVLDEPTRSMSACAEFEIFEGIRGLLGGRSALLVSHRFSTVRMVDRICVLVQDRIIEQGTHEELDRPGGTNAGMYELLARSYR